MNGNGKRIISVIALAATVALVSGCGGSSTITAPNTPKQIAADKLLAQNAVLRPSDMPDGYKATPPDNSANSKIPDAELTKFAACVKVPKSQVASLLNSTPGASQPNVEADFEIHPGTLKETDVDNNVELDRSSKDISEPFALFQAKSALSCWKGLFQAAFGENPTAGATSRFGAVVPLSTGSIHGEAVAFQVRVSITARGLTVPVDLDFYAVGRGRAGISLFASWIGGRPDNALELSLLQTVVGRLGGAA